jgi:hypothetical protein
MGMGHAGCSADVIEEKDISKVGKCGKLLGELETLLREADSSEDLDSLAQQLYSNGECIGDAVGELEGLNEGQRKQVKAVYEALQVEFKKKTGMTLDLFYHSQDEDGDRYDEVDGRFWTVYGWYCISPKAKKAQKRFKIKVETKFYTNFG